MVVENEEVLIGLNLGPWKWCLWVCSEVELLNQVDFPQLAGCRQGGEILRNAYAVLWMYWYWKSFNFHWVIFILEIMPWILIYLKHLTQEISVAYLSLQKWLKLIMVNNIKSINCLRKKKRLMLSLGAGTEPQCQWCWSPAMRQAWVVDFPGAFDGQSLSLLVRVYPCCLSQSYVMHE